MLGGARLVDHVNCAVRELAVIDVACSKFHRGFDRVVGVFDAVVLLEIGLDATKNFDGVFHGGFVYVDLLEAA